MASQISIALATSQATDFKTAAEANASPPYLRLMVAGYGTTLYEYTLVDELSSPAMNGGNTICFVEAANLPLTENALATGTIGSFRFYDGAGTVIWEGTGADAVGTSAAIVIVSSTSAISGQPGDLIAFRFGVPRAVVAE